MSRCVIVGSAEINDYETVKEYLKDDDYMVFCDGGLKHVSGIGKEPDLIVGDFDSHEKPETDIETIVLPCEKDDTDTCHALNECIARGYRDFMFLGCIGERMDHTLGNLYLLVSLKEKGLDGFILDDYSEISIVGDKGAAIEDKYSFFSILALSDVVDGIYIKDAKYPLENASIKSGFQYGISNEVIKGKKAEVKVGNGNLLLIKVM